MTEAFTKNGLDSPRLSAEILLTHVIGAAAGGGGDRSGSAARLALYTDPDRPAAGEELTALRGLVSRALRHEPIQYLTGEAWFFGLPMDVDRRVLIPRPCTEVIVEEVLQAARRARVGTGREAVGVEVAGGMGGESAAAEAAEAGASGVEAVPIRPIPKKVAGSKVGEGLLIADVCTGSGCIAVALLKHLPGARAIATDVSAEALEVARLNAARHGVLERLELLEGDLLGPLAERVPSAGTKPEGGGVDFLVTNPPYIPDGEWPGVEANVKDHEPEGALRGGADGLRFVEPLLRDGPALLKPGGLLLMEIASATAATVLASAQAHPRLEEAAILSDHEGLPRVLRARRKR
jgi:release factor glutamine methyltransferase